MKVTYSESEAKSRFSEILALVGEGETVSISENGKTVAEIRRPERKVNATEERFAELERRGILTKTGKRWKPSHAGDPMPGAVKQFLAER